MTNTNVIKAVVPSVAAMVYRAKELQSYMEPQTCAIASLAIYKMMSSFTRDDVVPAISMFELATAAIEQANRFNNDLKQFHYVDPAINLIGLAKHFGFVTMGDDKSFTMSPIWIELVTTKDTATPFLSPITDENRRKPYIKGGKVKPSKLLKEAANFLEETKYHVDADMVNIIDKALDMQSRNGAVVPTVIQQEMHVWLNSRNMVRESELYSETFGDNRGRLYHVACAGPNPQSSDFARSLYSHNVENTVNKLEAGSLSPSYIMFMNELNDIAGGKWCEAKMLTRVASNPSGALLHMLNSGDAPKKPFTYIRLALDWCKFETTGVCDSRIGFGLDAKCSGTQYLAFIAGNMQMAQATGLVDTDTKASDPYQLSLVQLIRLLNKSSMKLSDGNMSEYLNPKAGRTFIKTPYMAVQYGGGTGALLGNKDFVATSLQMGIEEAKLGDFAGICVEAIHTALGERINMFIAKVQESVLRVCNEQNKPYISYRHTDGQLVLKPCFPSRDICDTFSIRVGSKTCVIFGQQVEGKPWTIRESTPTKEEFVRTFVVNYIQGIDALVARTVAKFAKKAGLRGYTSIHDCFRCCLQDAPKMMDVIRQAYMEIFVHNNQFEKLAKQIGGIDMFHTNIVTEELLMSEHAYYFCQ